VENTDNRVGRGDYFYRNVGNLLYARKLPLLLVINGQEWYWNIHDFTYQKYPEYKKRLRELGYAKRPTKKKWRPFVKKPITPTENKKQKGQVSDKEFKQKYPTIVEWMTDLCYDDKSPREASKVSIWIEDGRCKLSFSDPTPRRSCYLTAESFEDALQALEDGLKADSLDWRGWNAKTRK